MENLKVEPTYGPSCSNSGLDQGLDGPLVIKTEPVDFKWLCDVMETSANGLMDGEREIKTEPELIIPSLIEEPLNCLNSLNDTIKVETENAQNFCSLHRDFDKKLKMPIKSKTDNSANRQTVFSSTSQRKCNHCQFKTKHFLQYKYHERKHLSDVTKRRRLVPKKFKCRQCYFSSVTNMGRSCHEQSHLIMKVHKCDQCGYCTLQALHPNCQQRNSFLEKPDPNQKGMKISELFNVMELPPITKIPPILPEALKRINCPLTMMCNAEG